jgi:[acyl-carrier-protein] S-malonyltransferase
MKSAQEKMTPLLKNLSFLAPCVPVVMNVSAESEENPTRFSESLIQQITSPVRWRESVLFMQTQGITHFIECGPGTVLSGLVRRIYPKSTQNHISDVGTLQTFLSDFQKNT